MVVLVTRIAHPVFTKFIENAKKNLHSGEKNTNSTCLMIKKRLDRPSDLELIRDVLNGDKRKFGALVNRHEHQVRKVATAMMGNEPTGRDVAQDVFVKLLSH